MNALKTLWVNKLKIPPLKTLLILLGGIALVERCSNSGVNKGLITDQNTYWPAPPLSKPAYLQTVTDPTFGTKITRIVGDPGDPLPNVPGEFWAAKQLRHGYSKREAWNCDQSMIFLDRHSPNLWLDGNTYEVLFTDLINLRIKILTDPFTIFAGAIPSQLLCIIS